MVGFELYVFLYNFLLVFGLVDIYIDENVYLVLIGVVCRMIDFGDCGVVCVIVDRNGFNEFFCELVEIVVLDLRFGV